MNFWERWDKFAEQWQWGAVVTFGVGLIAFSLAFFSYIAYEIFKAIGFDLGWQNVAILGGLFYVPYALGGMIETIGADLKRRKEKETT